MKVKFANTHCGVPVTTDTEISCTLVSAPAAGSWNVEVIDLKGLSPLAVDVVAIDVPLVITSITPNSALNQLGGDILNIVGTGFDPDFSKTTIMFSDNTACDIFFASASSIKCVVSGFDASTLNTANPYTVTVTVNAITNDSQTVMILDSKQSGQTVSPNSVSPVLAANLTITLEPTYPEPLTSKDDFTATLISRDDATFFRPLYVMAVDDATKTIVIKFPGAESGNYNIALVGKVVGRIDKTPLAITVTSQVTAISSNTGSLHGGQLMTIDGINFSTDKYDNPVKVGDFWCLVQTTSKTQITCRIMETGLTEIVTVQTLVFLRTSEEAVALVPTVYDYSEPLSVITDMTSAFDAATNKQVITLTGTGFPTDASTVELFIDDVKQTTLSTAVTTATFSID